MAPRYLDARTAERRFRMAQFHYDAMHVKPWWEQVLLRLARIFG